MQVMDALTQTATTFGMSFISLQAGQALSQYLTFEIILILLNPSRWGEIRGQSTAEDEKIERDERDELDEEIVEETERAERDEENDVVYPPPTGEEEREERGTAEPSSKEMLDENKREVKQGWSDDSNAEKFGKAQKAEERNGSYPPMNNPKSTSRSIPNTISSSSASHHRSSSLGQSSNSSAFRRTDDVSIPEDSILNSLSPTFTKDLMFIPIGIILWISSVFLCVFKTSSTFRPITISILFSPLGAITRWYLSRLNGISRAKRFPFFPLGTLSANLSATLIISLAFLCQRFGRNVSSSRSSSGIARTTLGCNVLYGLQEGFCGTLSTVSTFAVELTKLKPKRRAINYAGFSWVAGILICVIVVGVPWWTRGMDGSCVGITIWIGNRKKEKCSDNLCFLVGRISFFLNTLFCSTISAIYVSLSPTYWYRKSKRSQMVPALQIFWSIWRFDWCFQLLPKPMCLFRNCKSLLYITSISALCLKSSFFFFVFSTYGLAVQYVTVFSLRKAAHWGEPAEWPANKWVKFLRIETSETS